MDRSDVLHVHQITVLKAPDVICMCQKIPGCYKRIWYMLTVYITLVSLAFVQGGRSSWRHVVDRAVNAGETLF